MTASSGAPAPQWHRDLLAREPVFDRPEFIWDDDTFDAQIAPDFVEIAASGAWYKREDVKRVVLGRLAGTHPISLAGGYRIEDAEVVDLADGLAQVRYTLHGQGRVTRRSTLYRREGRAWQAVFHQGTVVDGASPLPADVAEPRQG